MMKPVDIALRDHLFSDACTGSENEASLAIRLGTGRMNVRMALRAMEEVGLVQIQEGRSGGVRASRTGLARLPLLLLIRAIRAGNPSIVEIEDVARTLGVLAIESAVTHLEEEDAVELRRLIALASRTDLDMPTYSALHSQVMSAVYRVAGRPLLALLAEALDQSELAVIPVRDIPIDHIRDTVEQLQRTDILLVEAVIAGDRVAAINAFREFGPIVMAAYKESFRLRRVPERVGGVRDIRDDRPWRKAERIADAILADIHAGRLTPGEPVGTEERLAATHEVSRPIVREAIAILERLGHVQSRAGRKGGTNVIHADIGPLIDRIAAELDEAGLTDDASEIADVRQSLEIAAVIAASSASGTPVPTDGLFADRLSAASGNHALKIMLPLCARISGKSQIAHDAEPMFAALSQGDNSLARRRLMRLQVERQSPT